MATLAELQANLDKANSTYNTMKAGLPNLQGDQGAILQYQTAYNQSQTARDAAQKAIDDLKRQQSSIVPSGKQPFAPKPVVTKTPPIQLRGDTRPPSEITPVTIPKLRGDTRPPSERTPIVPAKPVVDPTKVTPSTYDSEKLKDPEKWQVTEDQTIAGQLKKITSSGSPTMELAKQQGLLFAADRNLLNSSLAGQAAQNAVIQNALPIAQGDAEANLGATRYNVDTKNQFSVKNTDAENLRRNFNAQVKNRAGEFNAANAFNKQQALFEANVKASLAEIDNRANFDRQSQAIFGTLSDSFSKAIIAINTDTNMNQQSKDYSIQQLFNAYKAQISILSAVGSVPDVSRLLQA